MYRYLTQHFIAENSLTNVNGTILDMEADFLWELDACELKYGDTLSVYDLKIKDCTSKELKQQNISLVHVTKI